MTIEGIYQALVEEIYATCNDEMLILHPDTTFASVGLDSLDILDIGQRMEQRTNHRVEHVRFQPPASRKLIDLTLMQLAQQIAEMPCVKSPPITTEQSTTK